MPQGPIKLRAWRAALNITQEEAASRVGVSQGTYSEWENNLRMPEVGQVLKIADATRQSKDHYVSPFDWAETAEERSERLVRARGRSQRRRRNGTDDVEPTDADESGNVAACAGEPRDT